MDPGQTPSIPVSAVRRAVILARAGERSDILPAVGKVVPKAERRPCPEADPEQLTPEPAPKPVPLIKKLGPDTVIVHVAGLEEKLAVPSEAGGVNAFASNPSARCTFPLADILAVDFLVPAQAEKLWRRVPDEQPIRDQLEWIDYVWSNRETFPLSAGMN